MSQFAYPLDGEQNYTASQAGAFFAGRSSGVFSAEDNLRVSVSDARQLSVSPGIAWITTDTYWGKVFVSTDPVHFDLPTADGVLDVICRVVVQWNKTTNTPSILMKQGTFASEPEPPVRSTTDELYELVLADYLVQHGEIEASESRLTDQRLNEDLCGLMRDGVERIPTDALQAQAAAIIQMIEQAYADVIAGNVPPHSATHAFGGSDPLGLRFSDVSVSAATFIEDTTYEDFGYRAAVTLSGVTANMVPEVVFGVADAMSGIYAPVTACYDGGIYLYANAVPEADITIPTIICWKAVG